MNEISFQKSRFILKGNFKLTGLESFLFNNF